MVIFVKKIGLVIVNFFLVKIVIVGEDVNWGRVVMVVGKVGELVDWDKLVIWFGGYWVVREGVVDFSFEEVVVDVYLKGVEIFFEVDVGVGEEIVIVWMCDLMYGYIFINVDYRF